MKSAQEPLRQRKTESKSLKRSVNRLRKKRRRGISSRSTTSRIDTNRSFKLKERRYKRRTTDSWKSLEI